MTPIDPAIIKAANDLGPAVRAETDKWARAARWARTFAIILLTMVLFVAAYVLIFSRGVVEDTHRRNYNDLAVAARGLETWPTDVVRLARTNFTRDRLKPATPDEQTEGWQYAAELQHPDLGKLRIRYAIADKGSLCPQGNIDPDNGDPIAEPRAFIKSSRPGAGQLFIVADALSFDEIWAADMQDGAKLRPGAEGERAELVVGRALPGGEKGLAELPGTRAAATTTAAGDALPTTRKPAPAHTKRRICLRVAVPLDRLVALERTGEGFSHLLITDAQGHIFASTGAGELPIRTLDDLRLSSLDTLGFGSAAPTSGPNSASGAKTGSTGEKSASPPLSIGSLHRPGEIEIGNTTYTVYSRAFNLPGTPAPCTGESSDAKSDARANPPADPRFATCYAVALMPATTLRARWFSLPPALVFGFAMVVLAALALFPALRLTLIGGNESLHGLEVTGVLAGVQMTAGLAALMLLFVIEVSAEREAAHVQGAELVGLMSDSAGREIAAAVDFAATLAPLAGHGPRKAALALFNRAPQAPAEPPQPEDAAGPVAVQPVVETKQAEKPAAQGQQTQKPTKVQENDEREYGIDPGQWANGKISDPRDDAAVLPTIESIGFYDWSGRLAPYARAVTYRDNNAVRSDVGRRDYFVDLERSDNLAPPPQASSSLSYTIGVVRAQSDGIDKTVMAVDARTPRAPNGKDRLQRFIACPPLARCPEAASLNGAFVIPVLVRSFLAPVLPFPHHFLVIDRTRPDLPVLFHSERERGGVDQFAVQLGNRLDIRDALKAMPDRTIDTPPGHSPVRFSIPYDCRMQHFVAQPVPGTHWAVLVFHAEDDIDSIAALAGRWTLFLWVAVGAAALVVITLAFWLGSNGRPWYKPWQQPAVRVGSGASRGRWRRYWPHEAAGDEYARLVPLLCGAALAMLVAVAGAAIADIPGLGVLLVVAIVTTVLAIMARRLAAIGPMDAPLSPRTQQRFGWLVAALLLCTAVGPTLAFWVDALAMASTRRDAIAYQAASRAEKERNLQTSAIQQAFFGFDSPHRQPSINEGPGVFPAVGNDSPAPLPPLVLVSDALRSFQNGLPDPIAELCEGEMPGTVCATSPLAIAGRHLPQVYLAGLIPSGRMFLRIIMIAALAVGMVAGLAWSTRRIFRSLFGFEVALAPAQLPMLWLGEASDPKKTAKYHDLGEKTLLVAPQRALRDRLMDPQKAELVDLVAETGRTDKWHRLPSWDKHPRIVAFNLELVLRDPERRRAALAILEKLAAGTMIRTEATATTTAIPGRSLVVISDRAPLDRIFDAFDIERSRSDSETSATQKAREELRWSRLFQDFATFNFAPVDKIDNNDATRRIKDKAPSHGWAHGTQQGIATLIDEMRWLPGLVIDGATFKPATIESDDSRNARNEFPVPSSLYRTAYTRHVTEWACDMQPASSEAAVDFAWSSVIEFYQQCWSSSTHGERLVLDALAKGRFVNFVAALSLKSLVRRGLVVLDPAPRLMNASFAAFVRQAERPETLATWRIEQPSGGWAAARLPISIGLVAMVVALGFVIGSDQSLASFVPLLAAGAPALTTTLANLLRRG